VHPAAESLGLDDHAFLAGGQFQAVVLNVSPARPKIACSNFSSGDSSLLDLGETLPP